MTVEKNFTGNKSQKTIGDLYCSEELKGERLGELIFVAVLNILLSIAVFLEKKHSN